MRFYLTYFILAIVILAVLLILTTRTLLHLFRRGDERRQMILGKSWHRLLRRDAGLPAPEYAALRPDQRHRLAPSHSLPDRGPAFLHHFPGLLQPQAGRITHGKPRPRPAQGAGPLPGRVRQTLRQSPARPSTPLRTKNMTPPSPCLQLARILGTTVDAIFLPKLDA